MAGPRSLARLSAYKRAEEHLSERTVHGGIVTIVGVLVAVVLFIAEAGHCLSYRMVQTMRVDTEREKMLRIDFNLTFPALPCSTLMMDVGDVSGSYASERGLSMAHNGELHKWRLDANGRRLDRAEYHPPHANDLVSPFSFGMDLDQGHLLSMKAGVKAHEGCLVYGWVSVQRVAGNLHFSVRPEALFMSMNENEIITALLTRSVMLNIPADHVAPQLNASHVIDRLRFGDAAYPGQGFPLEGVRRIDRVANGVDKYFVKVVPTRWYPGGWRSTVATNQYSVTEYYQRLESSDRRLLPGLFILYDTSPIAVDIHRRRPGWLHLLVRAAAVVGGAFALTGFWDRVIHALVQRLSPQLDLGAAPNRIGAFHSHPHV